MIRLPFNVLDPIRTLSSNLSSQIYKLCGPQEIVRVCAKKPSASVAYLVANLTFPYKLTPAQSSLPCTYPVHASFLKKTPNMLAIHLLPTLFALSTPLSIPSPPTLLHLPPLNAASIQNTPWPPAPFRFSLSTTLPLTMNILSYGARGPPNPGATILLKALFEKFSAEGDESDRILNHTESAFGITAKFGTAGTGAGITRLQAGAVFRRIWGLTIVHDAIGIEKCEIEMGGVVVEKFELEYRFEENVGIDRVSAI